LSRQKTIKSEAVVEGRGLFSGEPARLRFAPAGPGAGIVFVRSDLAEPVRIRTAPEHVAKRARRTSLMNGSVTVETVEHVLSAACGLGVDNLVVDLNGAETPSTDGSPLPFVEALQQAGLVEQDADRKPYVIAEPVHVNEDDAMLAALPGPEDALDILYDLDYGDVPTIGRQVLSFRLGSDDFAAELAPARTFCLEAEARALTARGKAPHLSPKDVLVIGESGPIENEWHWPDEAVRHKICDLIGDLALLGRPVCGRVVAYRSGHELNRALVMKLAEQMRRSGEGAPAPRRTEMNVRKVMRLLPHRYPFLMIDRVVELQGDSRAVGIKNVTINEPFFQGHYPGQPIMPGVMILEAMAQLSGVLLSQRLEHTGKVAVLLSMDRVKMRRPVRPGDQLVLEAEALHVRSRTGHCRCRARVGSETAAEAEIKFMLVDSEPV
jgi:UDP-3-O-[3-hydroxymyristoyl] N-acetylglucosamine deacetylase/3-hydroxyacyl-[acyl-carrier-protein] dehydratase